MTSGLEETSVEPHRHLLVAPINRKEYVNAEQKKENIFKACSSAVRQENWKR